MKRKFLPHYRKVIISVISVILLWLTVPNYSFAQSGYIYLHKKSLDEGSSPNFTFNFSGGPTAVSAITLNDQATAIRLIQGLGADASGGLWALAGNAIATNYLVYYRGAASSEWLSVAGAAVDIDGGAAETYISSNAAGSVFYYDGTILSNVTGNLPAAAFKVSDNWSGRQYALLSNNQVWTRLTSSLTWTQVPGIQAMDIDAVPGTNRFVYVITGDQEAYSATFNGTGVTYLDFLPIYAVNIAVTQSGDIYVTDTESTYHRVGSTWVAEPGGMQLQNFTGGPATQFWGNIPTTGTATSERIISRTESGDYLADENIRLSLNDNSTMIAVAPGTYTITETAVPGWKLNSITFYESQSPSSFDVPTSTATVVVGAGEVVHVVYENQLTQTTTIVNDCNAASTFKETFGTGTGYGGPLTGLTSYHFATADFGYGYYSLIRNSNLMGTYAGSFTDHTGDPNGRMLAVDATVERGIFYRRRFDGLIPGATYSFSAWILNVNNRPNKPNVTFGVYDPITGSLLSSANSGDVTQVGIWKQATLVFTATQSVLDLELNNNTLGTNGNDLLIDDITFGVAIPQPVVSQNDITCNAGGTITVQSPLSSGYEYSIDGVSYQSSPSFTNLMQGNYSVTARYISGTCESPPTPVTLASAECPPVATDDNSINNLSGSTVTINILTNDVISNGSEATPSNTTVALTTTGLPVGSTLVGNLLTVPGEGSYTYDPTTGNLSFYPQSGFTGNPTPLTYILTQTSSGLSDPALVSITYGSLPVKLVSFNANLVENRVRLSWSTTEEINSDYFEIQRSIDARNWNVIGIESSHRESQALIQYQHWDQQPLAVTSYYRLKMVDMDQSYTFSKIASIYNQAGELRPVIYPVPAKDVIHLSQLDLSSVKEIVILNLAGITVYKSEKATAQGINIQNIPTGLYLLRIATIDGMQFNQKIVIQR
jgi:hypothetical protein